MTKAVEYSAPGRINLIGEHTDYNYGFALPIALPERTTVSFQPDGTDTLVVCSDREASPVRFALNTVPGDVDGWAAYVAGVVWALRGAGHPVPGGAMAVTGGVTTGSGLASSAALECAALGAILAATGRAIDRVEQARIAQRAENDYVGAPTGLLDQLAILFAERRRAQLIDFRDLSVRSVPFEPEAHGVTLLLINSHAAHQHAGGEYADRRTACERAAAAFGVLTLRDLQNRGPQVLTALPESEDCRRARHILTENQRVLDTVEALHRSDFVAVGRLLTASQESMRDDFEITTDHIDLIAETAVQAGALGARMTGGGFGGCVIALVDTERSGAVGDAVRASMRRHGHREPTIVATHAGQGAGG
ncbi:galactokinase [Mycolicibacterium sp. P9-22]|uniref:galactokinase n=1 Tax=Mycolicibacterium sp. P9-22 TaxID=2024613 RepID=UPI0011EC18CB|nr:galactokinase [Mycolicibacterium sp. P9-22]KAA0117937.1 galactokinase [Mycolicibacterium sp. P9-22]